MPGVFGRAVLGLNRKESNLQTKRWRFVEGGKQRMVRIGRRLCIFVVQMVVGRW